MTFVVLDEVQRVPALLNEVHRLIETRRLRFALLGSSARKLRAAGTNLLRIYRAIRSPWLGINLDTGNFPGDPYAGLEPLAKDAVIVQAKTSYGGGKWYTLDLDYPRIAGILRNAGFQGWVSLEMEGEEDATTAVPKSLAVLRSAFGA